MKYFFSIISKLDLLIFWTVWEIFERVGQENEYQTCRIQYLEFQIVE